MSAERAAPKDQAAKRSKGAQPHVRSAWTFLILVAFSGALVLYYRYASAQDVALATGPTGPDQERFFKELSKRPDALPIFERMLPEQRLKTARNLAAYSGPEVADLAATFLDSFDANARRELTTALSKLASVDPALVSRELSRGSSYQTEGVFLALKSAGAAAIPAVAQTLKSDAHRSNAIRLLVEIGQSSTPELLRIFLDEDKIAKLAVAEALGKLRAKAAVPLLIEAYEQTKSDARTEYLSALAEIGDARAAPLLDAALANETLQRRVRQQAALGVGRIGSAAGVRNLFEMTKSIDSELADAAWSGLTLAGDAALKDQKASLEARLRVAKSLPSPIADHVIANAMKSTRRETVLAALDAAQSRPSLVAKISACILAFNPNSDGDLIESGIAALYSTDIGRGALTKFNSKPGFRGFALRQARLR